MDITCVSLRSAARISSGEGETKFFQQVPAGITARTVTGVCVLSPQLSQALSFLGPPGQSPNFCKSSQASGQSSNS